MRRLAKYLIAFVATWGAQARAEGEPPPSLTDEQALELANAEAIEIYDERPDKPFDRDTEVRLTGEELAARGAVDLKSALALLPDVTVRDAGRGGFQIDIRGARKGEVSILIDGVLVSDPYYGNFDVSTIPITDIVQIRVATTPQSPIDGPGGPGGVVEVHTRDAIGPQLVIARLTSDTLPTVGMTATSRVALSKHTALRLSGAGLGGSRDLPLPSGQTLGEQRHAATGSTRLEYRDGDRRVAVDGFIDDRHYISPPSDDNQSVVLMIDRETSARASVRADDKRGKLQLQAQAFTAYLARTSRRFMNATLDTTNQVEDLSALRTGGGVLATHPIGKEARWVASANVVHESADVTTTMPMRTAESKGDVTLIEAAGDGQYEHGPVRLDGAVGVAVPFGVPASPWPEAKLSAKWRARHDLELDLTGGRKGRVPSLRERFDSLVGNPDLGPEISEYGELRAIGHLDDRWRLELAPFYRHTTGTIKTATGTMDMMMLVNTGTLDVYGVDVMGKARVHPRVELSAAYDFIKATSDATGDVSPLDFLPRHKLEGSVRVDATKQVFGLVRVRHVSSQTDGGNTIAPYTLVEGNVTAQLSPEDVALLRFDDLLNARPETRFGYHSPGRVITLILQGTWQ